jgi:hypothetical protein
VHDLTQDIYTQSEVAVMLAAAERRGFDNGVEYVIGLMEPLLGDLPHGGCSDPQCADCATEWDRVDAPTVLLSRVDSTNPGGDPA